MRFLLLFARTLAGCAFCADIRRHDFKRRCRITARCPS